MGSGGLQGAVVRAQLGIRDQHVDTRIAQNEIHLVGLEEIIDRHDYRAGLEDAEHRWDEFGAILKPKPYPVAGFNPIPLPELVRDEVGQVPEFVIGVFALAPVQGDLMRVLLDGFCKCASQVHDRRILRILSQFVQGDIYAATIMRESVGERLKPRKRAAGEMVTPNRRISRFRVLTI